MGERTTGERGHGMAQVIVRMVTIGASDNVLRGTQYSRHIVDAHAEL